MLTILSFLIMVAGGVNWLMIGLLQYDFIAGIFGFQGSIFSRILYIVIGAATAFFVFKVLKGKGKVSVFSRRNKQDMAKNIAKMNNQTANANVNVEASSENLPKQEQGLLNEHLHEDDMQ